MVRKGVCRGDTLMQIDRVVKSVVRDARPTDDEIRNPPPKVKQTQLREAGPSEEIRDIHGMRRTASPNDRFDIHVPDTLVVGDQ